MLLHMLKYITHNYFSESKLRMHTCTCMSQGYKLVKTCQEFSPQHHCQSYAWAALCLNPTPLNYPLLPCSPPALFLQYFCFSLSLLPVSKSWQLVSSTVLPQPLGCVRLTVCQRVKQLHRASPAKYSCQQVSMSSLLISLSYLQQDDQWGEEVFWLSWA